MAEYDGSIRIDTSIITKNIRPKVQEIVKSLEEIGKDAEKAREKLELLDKAGVSHASEEYKAAQAELQKYVDSYKDSMYKIAEYGSGVSDSLQFDTSKIDAAREKLQSLEDSGIDHSSKEYKEAERDLNHLIDAHERYQEVIDEFGSYTINAFEGFKKLRDETEKYINTSGIQAESTDEVSQHLNILRIDVEEYAKALKELHDQGKFFGDEDYDKIYLAWKNATDAVKTYQSELNKQTESGQAKIAEQEARAAEKREAAQRRAEEQAEKALQKENARIQKEVENQAKLEAKEAERKAREEARINAIQAKEEAKRAKEIAAIQAQEQEEQRLDQIRVNATVSNQEIVDLLERRRQLISEIKDMEAAGVGLGYQQYEDANRELEEVNGKIKEYRKNLGSVPEKFNKMRKSANKAFTAVAQGTKKSSGLLSNFTSRLKGIALSLLIFNWISKGFNAMISGMKKGFENFAGYSDSYAQNIQNMKNAMSTLGNQFAAAFAPIVQMVIPWLTQLINTLSKAMTYVSQFFAVLGGKSTFTKAKQVQDEYNKSLGGTAKAADKARGALAKFDDLDVLEKQEDTSGGGGDSDNTGEDMFEEAPIESQFEELAEKAKEVLSQLFVPLKEAWESQGEFVMESWRYALEEIGLLAKSVGKDFLEVWNQPETISVLENILIIAGDIGLVAGNLAARFREAWEANDVGLSILENIRNLFGIIIEHVRNAADATVEWSKNLDFSPMLESINGLLEALQPLADNIGAGLEWFYTNVLLPIAGWTIEDAVPAFLDMLSAAIETANEVIEALKPLGQWLWDEFLQPLGEWAGEAIISAMETITDLLKKFGDWIAEHQEAVQTFAIIIGSFATAWTVATLAVTAWNIVAGIATVATTAFGAAVAFLTSPIGIAIVAIGAIIAIGVLLYKNWDTIKEKAKEVWDFVKKKFEEFSTWLKGIFEKDWTESFGAIGEVLNVFFDTIGEVWDSIKDIFGGIIDFLTGVFTGDWEKAWDGVTKIFDGIAGVIGGIVDGIIGVIKTVIEAIQGAIQKIKEFFSESSKASATGPVGGAFSSISGMSSNSTNSARSVSGYSMVDIPHLATGSVIRGGNPFMAILGDQPRGQVNVEAPLDTIKQAVREELSGMNFGNAGVGQAKVVLNINGVDVGEAMLDDLFSVMQRRGYDVSVLGVR